MRKEPRRVIGGPATSAKQAAEEVGTGVKDLISGWLTSLGENPVLEGHRFSRAVNDTAIPGYLAAASIIR
jgi:hypothetical protein